MDEAGLLLALNFHHLHHQALADGESASIIYKITSTSICCENAARDRKQYIIQRDRNANTSQNSTPYYILLHQVYKQSIPHSIFHSHFRNQLFSFLNYQK